MCVCVCVCVCGGGGSNSVLSKVDKFWGNHRVWGISSSVSPLIPGRPNELFVYIFWETAPYVKCEEMRNCGGTWPKTRQAWRVQWFSFPTYFQLNPKIIGLQKYRNSTNHRLGNGLDSMKRVRNTSSVFHWKKNTVVNIKYTVTVKIILSSVRAGLIILGFPDYWAGKYIVHNVNFWQRG